jgi:hypothetical protein
MLKTLCIVILAAAALPAAFAAISVDNVLVDSGAEPLKLTAEPLPGMQLMPGVAPNIKLTPYERQTVVWPGYLVSHRYVDYELAVSCGTDPQLPCSPATVDDFSTATMTVRFVQTADEHFVTPEGLRVGSNLPDVLRVLDGREPEYSGSGACIRLPSGWQACFYRDDLLRDANLDKRRPKPTAQVIRFLKADTHQ